MSSKYLLPHTLPTLHGGSKRPYSINLSFRHMICLAIGILADMKVPSLDLKSHCIFLIIPLGLSSQHTWNTCTTSWQLWAVIGKGSQPKSNTWPEATWRSSHISANLQNCPGRASSANRKYAGTFTVCTNWYEKYMLIVSCHWLVYVHIGVYDVLLWEDLININIKATFEEKIVDNSPKWKRRWFLGWNVHSFFFF